jgi:sugar phosphate isomerase/epimerase
MMSNRRDFLRVLSGVLAGAAGTGFVPPVAATAGSQPGSAAGKPRKVPVAAHPWVYAATQPNHDITPVLEQIFADMAYAGLDGIELMHNVLRSGETVGRIAELSERHRLPVIGTSYGAAMWNRREHAAILEDAECILTHLASLGGRTLGTSVGAAPQRKTAEQLDDQADLLRKLIRMAADRGIVLNLHNHTYEVADDMHDLRGTLQRIPDVKLGPDLNWLVRGGVDPVWFLDTYGKQIVFLHLRDQRADGRWSEALGEGDMDYQAIGRALERIGFSGDAVIELAHERDFQPTRPLRESLKISRQFVRQTLGY